MSVLFLLVIVTILVLNWQTVKDAWNGKLPPPVPSTKKPWHYCGYNGYHRCRRRNSFNGMKRFFKS